MCCCCCFFFSQEAVKTSPNLAHEMAGQTMAKGIFGPQKSKKMGKGAYSSVAENNWQLCHAFTFWWVGMKGTRGRLIIFGAKKQNKCEIACCGSLSCWYFPQRILFPKKTTKRPFSQSKYQEPSLQKQSKVVALFISYIPAGYFCGEILSRCRISFFNGR